MTQENKDLLLKDLCARLPYKVKISIPELFTNYKACKLTGRPIKHRNKRCGCISLYRANINRG